jgi:hypothetical protein
VKPEDPAALRAALESTGARIEDRDGYLVAARGIEAVAVRETVTLDEHTVAWARLDLGSLSRLLGRGDRGGGAELRLARGGGVWRLEATLDPAAAR